MTQKQQDKKTAAALAAKGHYDVIIIGAGVVGCAMTRRFALEGAKVLLVEKATDILEGASKANSAILHTGFDEVPGSIEHQCVSAGYQEYLAIRHKMSLPILETGAMVVAWNEAEDQQLTQLLAKSFANGVENAEIITSAQIAAKEPHLARTHKAALYVPGEHVIDPWTTPFSYLLQAIENGASVLRNTLVLSGEFDGQQWQLETNNGMLTSNSVINCSGLYGDQIDKALIKETAFIIKPRKGEFLVFDKAASKHLKSIILPVPTKVTKGVVVCRTIFGNILVGPTADEQQSREDCSVKAETLAFLRKKGEQILPSLAQYAVTATYAGLRPATEHQDYCIKHYSDKNYVSVGGIRSTGLSGALGIASYVFKQYTSQATQHEPITFPVWPSVTQIAETEVRDWQKPHNQGIVCHCELVTKREIDAALEGPLAAASLSALKRRTRVTMGRCQGFYCSANLSEMTAGKFQQPLGVQDDK